MKLIVMWPFERILFTRLLILLGILEINTNIDKIPHFFQRYAQVTNLPAKLSKY